MHKILFSGELVAGFDEDEVKANLGRLFKIDDTAKLDALFSGKEITLKKNLEAEQARKYEATLSKAGAMCRLDPPLTQFDDEEEELPPPTTSGAALNFNTVAMATPEALAAGTTESAAVADEPVEETSNKKKVLMLVAVVAILLVSIFAAMRWQEAEKAEILSAAGNDSAEFEQTLEDVEDPQMRETLNSLHALMQEAQAEAEKYEQRDAALQQELDETAAVAEQAAADAADDAAASAETPSEGTMTEE